jgi:hypothetical protein
MSPEKENESHSEESCRSRGCLVGDMLDFIFNLPGEQLDHFRQAKIEFWRGIRNLIDRRIECLESVSQRRKSSVQKVNVE